MAIFNEFPQTNFHELNLDWIIAKVKELAEEWRSYNQKWDDAESEWQAMKEFIQNYFDNLDVNTHLTEVVQALIESGELAPVLAPYVSPAVSAWLTEHAMSWTGAIDTSLTIASMAADAKVTGDYIRALQDHIAPDLFPGITNYNQGQTGNLNWAWNAARTKLTITGNTMDGAKALTLYSSASIVPSVLIKGGVYYFDFTAASDGLNLQVRFRDANSNQIAYHQMTSPTFIEIPANAAGMTIAIGAKNGYSFNVTQDAPIITRGLWETVAADPDYNALYKVAVSNKIASDADARTAFMDVMNATAARLGINATFDSPAGLTRNVNVTPLELLKLGVAAFTSPTTLKTWGILNDTITVAGATARDITMNNSYMQGVIYQMGGHGVVIGGKGGSLDYTSTGGDIWRSQLTVVLIQDKEYLISIMGRGQTAFDNLYRAVGQIVYKIYCSLTGEPYNPQSDYISMVTNSGGYCAIEIPKNAETLLNIAPADLRTLPTYEGINDNFSGYPCSVTKVLTCLVADDIIVDRHVKARVILTDLVDTPTTTGYRIYNDDYISITDLFKMAMIISHNGATETLARTVGKMILMNDDQIRL